tara:strand:+ start:1096 stop:1641 length:546 start_codon:yes stop_codon:yes gene_type:complete
MDTFKECPYLTKGRIIYNKIWNDTYELYKSNKDISLETKAGIIVQDALVEMDDVSNLQILFQTKGSDEDADAGSIMFMKGNRKKYLDLCFESSEGMRVMCWGIMKQNKSIAYKGYERHRDSGVNMITESMDVDEITTQKYKDFADKIGVESRANKTFLYKIGAELGWWKVRFDGKKMYKFC